MSVDGHLSPVREDVAGAVMGVFRVDRVGTSAISARMVFQILVLGLPIGEWIVFRMYEHCGERAECHIYDGHPLRAGRLTRHSAFGAQVTSRLCSGTTARMVFRVGLIDREDADGIRPRGPAFHYRFSATIAPDPLRCRRLARRRHQPAPLGSIGRTRRTGDSHRNR